MKVSIVYWSGTGNTEAMANAVAEGAKNTGAEVELLPASAASADVIGSDALLFGCPAMGSEELEESEFEPFFSSVEGSLSGKKMGLFGSYDWGDGEWMRTWQQRVVAAGGVMIEDGPTHRTTTPSPPAARSAKKRQSEGICSKSHWKSRGCTAVCAKRTSMTWCVA